MNGKCFKYIVNIYLFILIFYHSFSIYIILIFSFFLNYDKCLFIL